MDWFGALSFCINFGMDLAIIETKPEENAILATMTSSSNNDYVWLGGSDVGSTGEYYWVKTGAPVRSDIKWNSTEPDGPGSQHYMKIYRPAAEYVFGNTFEYAEGYPLCQEVETH